MNWKALNPSISSKDEILDTSTLNAVDLIFWGLKYLIKYIVVVRSNMYFEDVSLVFVVYVSDIFERFKSF